MVILVSHDPAILGLHGNPGGGQLRVNGPVVVRTLQQKVAGVVRPLRHISRFAGDGERPGNFGEAHRRRILPDPFPLRTHGDLVELITPRSDIEIEIIAVLFEGDVVDELNDGRPRDPPGLFYLHRNPLSRD